MFAAAAADIDEADAANNSYRAAFTALTRADGTPVDNINEALSGLKAFNPNNDQNISRGSLISLWLRTKVIGLNYDSLKDVMDANPDFFRAALGLSVLYGWAQNWFDNSIQKTTNLSYLKLFHNMADSIGDSIGAADGSAEEVKAFLIAAFDQGLSAVAGDSASFKEFSINNLYLRGAIELANSRPGALLPIAGVIAGVYNTRDQAVAEAVALERVRHDAALARAAAQQAQVHAEEQERQRLLRVAAAKVVIVQDLGTISTPNYMIYDEKNLGQYPAKVRDIRFQTFRNLMQKYRVNMTLAIQGDIARLYALDGDKDLHGDREIGLGGFGYPSRRAAITRVLGALRAHLTPLAQ